MQERRLGNLYGENKGTGFAGNVWDTNTVCPCLTTMGGGNRQPMIIVAMRGRNPENPTSRVAGLPTEQRLEPNLKGVSNTLTSVQKDNLVMERMPKQLGFIDNGTGKHQSNTVYSTNAPIPALTTIEGGGTQQVKVLIDNPLYRIRKLTPLECWRLMGFTDNDFHKAKAVNSNTQLYKQAGNSIVKDVLIAIFEQMM